MHVAYSEHLLSDSIDIVEEITEKVERNIASILVCKNNSFEIFMYEIVVGRF